jgi:phage shock protein PspC (stress-responsive transcriptional regulator)
MQKVITVSLNGNAYQLDEDAYRLLSRYLDESAAALAGNPDKSEIIADLEQAIGEKCARFLNAHKTVVIGSELQQIVAEMGPVDGDPGKGTGDTAAGEAAGTAGAASAGAGASAAGTAGTAGSAGYTGQAGAPPPFVSRRLYQISDGAVFSGVCNGLAAYFAIDVTLVRAIFIALFLFTGGLALLAYVVLMFVVPYASTSEEHAAARGLPFNARTLVERAKQKYTQFANGPQWRGTRAEWRKEWRRMRAEWRFERRRMREEWRTQWRFGRGGRPPDAAFGATGGAGVRPAPVSYVAHIIIGTILAILGIVSALFTVGWLLVLLSLVTTGAVLGWTLPHGIPFWAALLLLLIVYSSVAWPIKALRHAAYASVGAYHGAWVEAWNGIIALAVVVTLLWYGFHHVPEVRELFNQFAHWWNSVMGGNLGEWT